MEAVDVARHETALATRGAADALDLIRDLSVQTPAERDFAAEVLRDVKRSIDELEDRRKRITVPLNGALSEVNELFRPAREALKACEAALKGKIAAYLDVQAEANRRAFAEAALAENPEQAETAMASAITAALPSGVSIRKVWRFEVVDANAVPREFCSPDPKKIGAVAGTCEVVGVRFFQEDIVSSRKS